MGTMEMARNSMRVARAGAEVSGNNLANASNPVYSRQRIKIGSAVTIPTEKGPQGSGSEVGRLEQVRDKVLDKSLVSEKSVTKYFEAKELFSDQKINSNELFTKSNFYLVNIWSSWCAPCRDEHPFLLKLQNENKVKLIGINYKDNKKNALKFIEELSNPFDKIVSDKNGTLSIKLGAYGVPESFLIDQDKKILKKIVGPIDQKSYSKIIEILNEKN